MKRRLTVFLLILPLAAQAEEAPAKEVFLVLSAGLTYGGDTVGRLDPHDDATVRIKGGGLTQLGIGGEWHRQDWPVSIRATVNYQFMQASNRSGSVSFARAPLELLAYYHANDQWQIGAGVRRVSEARYQRDMDNDHTSGTARFKPATGAILELAYKFSPRHQLALRYVNERYRFKSDNNALYPVVAPGSYDGSHGGIFVNLLF